MHSLWQMREVLQADAEYCCYGMGLTPIFDGSRLGSLYATFIIPVQFSVLL